MTTRSCPRAGSHAVAGALFLSQAKKFSVRRT